MELALFPIAAVLLLLSGAGAPVHLAGRQDSPAALFRRLFVPEPASAQASAPYGHYTKVLYKSPYNGHALHQSSHKVDPLIANRVRRACNRTSYPLYRSRFGVRSRAYLATAPPLA